MPFHKIFASLALGTALISSTGCAPKIGGSDYSIKGVGEIGQVHYGQITNVRPINVQAKALEDQGKPGVGALGGGVGGAVLGSTIGGGARSHALFGVLGALGGAAAGHAVEGYATSQQGFEYQVRLDSGASLSVTQGIEPALAVGQRVKVITSAKDRNRVVPA